MAIFVNNIIGFEGLIDKIIVENSEDYGLTFNKQKIKFTIIVKNHNLKESIE